MQASAGRSGGDGASSQTRLAADAGVRQPVHLGGSKVGILLFNQVKQDLFQLVILLVHCNSRKNF